MNRNLSGVLLLAVFLTGCTALMKAETVLDAATDKYCAAPAERAIVKTALDPVFRSHDKAACIRCPGEENLSCVGDPKGLPPAQ